MLTATNRIVELLQDLIRQHRFRKVTESDSVDVTMSHVILHRGIESTSSQVLETARQFKLVKCLTGPHYHHHFLIMTHVIVHSSKFWLHITGTRFLITCY